MVRLIDRADNLLPEFFDVTVPLRVTEGFSALLRVDGHAGGVAVAPDGSIFVSDSKNATIWLVSEDGAASRYVHAAEGDFTSTTRLFGPAGLALGPDGALVVADASHDRIASVGRDGAVRVLAGGSNGYRDGPAAEAMFRRPEGVVVALDGTCFVADTGNDRIRRISPDGIVTTLAGSIYDYGDGRGANARFRRPAALALSDDEILYVADTGNNALRVVAPDGVVTTFAGAPPAGDHDGVAPDIGLRGPSGVAIGPGGELWVADHDNAVLRRIGPDGRSETRLRLPDGHWPVALGWSSRGQLALLIETLDDVANPATLLVRLTTER